MQVGGTGEESAGRGWEKERLLVRGLKIIHRGKGGHSKDQRSRRLEGTQ